MGHARGQPSDGSQPVGVLHLVQTADPLHVRYVNFVYKIGGHAQGDEENYCNADHQKPEKLHAGLMPAFHKFCFLLNDHQDERRIRDIRIADDKRFPIRSLALDHLYFLRVLRNGQRNLFKNLTMVPGRGLEHAFAVNDKYVA